MKWVVAATVAGFAASGVGLAAADVLPAPVQDVAHHALNTVGVHVPPGHQRFNDPTICPGGPYANHGAYVRAHHDDANSGTSDCGKPDDAVAPGHEIDANHKQAGEHSNGKQPQNPHPAKGNGLKPHGKPDDTPDTNINHPTVPVTPSTSMPASTTTSTTTTTSEPTTTTTSAPASPTP